MTVCAISYDSSVPKSILPGLIENSCLPGIRTTNMNCQRSVKYDNMLFYKLNSFNTNSPDERETHINQTKK
jgi:hypothetical protein